MKGTEPATTAPPRRRKLTTLLLVASLIAFYMPMLISSARRAADPMRFNDDARQQIWPFLRFYDHALFHTDAIADYYLACTPSGYKALYTGFAKLMDPRILSKVLPYLLLAVTVGASATAARRIEGRWAAWAAAGLCLGSPVFLGRMGGGLPRSFAFPLYALAALALVGGRPLILAAIVVVAAGFYPTASVTCGVALVVMLFVLPRASRGFAADWNIARRLGLTAAAALLAGLVILPNVLATRPYGQVLRPTDAQEYPENGPGGRYSAGDRAPQLLSHPDLTEYFRAPLSGIGGPWEGNSPLLRDPIRKLPMWGLAVLGCLGATLLAVRDVRTRRLLLLGVAALLAHIISIPFSPYLYLPQRYLIYPLAIVAAIAVPVGVAALPLRFAKASHAASARAPTMLAVCGAYLLFLFFTDGRGVRSAGIEHMVDRHLATYRYLSALPPGTLIAGWPNDVDDVPYLSERSVLVSRETHQAFHREYADLMRRRMAAVIAATFAADPAPLQQLRDDFGVTYFVADRSLYGPVAPKYFAPFDEKINAARAALGAARPAVLAEHLRAEVLKDDDWIVLDLNRLPYKGGK